MDPTCSLRIIDEMHPRFSDYRIVPKIQMVADVTSEPTISNPWDPRNRVAVQHQPLFRRCFSLPRSKVLCSLGKSKMGVYALRR